MILDILARLADPQNFTDADEVTDRSYDCGNPEIKNRVGTGTPLSVLFVVTTAAAGDSASATNTTDLTVVEDTAADLNTKTPIISRRVPASEMVVGAIFDVPIPVGKPTKRYLGAQVVQGTGDTVSMQVFVVPSTHVQGYLAYANGYSI